MKGKTMQHAIKIRRAYAAAGIGGCPQSRAAMLQYLPEEVVERLPSRELARMLDALWAACQDAKALGARDAIDEGAIWDARLGRLREIGA